MIKPAIRGTEQPSAPLPDGAGRSTQERLARWVPASWLPYIAAALSAGLLALAHPPADLGWLAWGAPIPYFWALLHVAQAAPPGTHGRQLAWRGFKVGFAHSFLLLLYLTPWFASFTPLGYPIAGAYWGLLGGLVAGPLLPLLTRLSPGWTPWLLASGWTLLEWLRAQGVLAFPWGMLSATQYRYLPVLQGLDLYGAYGLSFLMALLGAAAWIWRRHPQQATRRTLLLAAVLTAGTLARGFWILASPPPATERVRAALVQASESRPSNHIAVETVGHLEDYEAYSRQAIEAGADLIVWPESAVRADVIYNSAVRQRILQLLWGTNSYLLTGSFVGDPETGQSTNSAVLFSPGGRVQGQYAKVRIVPFGEYLPARPLLGWTEHLGMPPTDLKAGKVWNPLPWPHGTVGVSICFESAFGDISRRYVKQGANLRAVLTSDGWAGRATAGKQHATFAPLRAVETRRTVVRAGSTGISQIIDPYGRSPRAIPMFEKGVLIGEAPLRTGLTLYVRLGDWPVPLSALLLLAGSVTLLRRRHAPSS